MIHMLLLGVGGPAAAAPPAGFSPTDLFGLELWLPGSSYVVGTWTDMSGKGRNATQGTGANQPSLQSSIPELNSKPVARGDGTDDYLDTAAFATAIAHPLYQLIVARAATTGLIQKSLVDSTPANRNNMAFDSGGATAWWMFAGSTAIPGPTVNRLRFNTFGGRFNGAASYPSLNNVSGTVGSPGTNTMLGARLFWDGASQAGKQLDGDIAEYILYSTDVGAYDRYRLDGYLTSKYAIPTSFLPTSITGCQLWLLGDDLGAVDSAISSWADQSGNGRNATQGTGSSQPAVKIGVNGKKCASFDGGDQLDTSSFGLNNLTCFFVFRATGNGLLYMHNPGGADISYLYTTTGNTVNIQVGATQSAKDLSASWGSDGLWRTAVQAYDGTHAGHKLYLNGADQTLSTAATGTPGLRTGVFRVGAGNGGLFLTGQISEVIIYNAALTDSQRQQVEGYLANKYAINAAIRPFDPLSVAGCKGWWRVDGGCDVNTDGSSITTLYDRSGNGVHLTQSTGGNKPTYETNEINTYAIARFDGTDDRVGANFAAALAQPCTLFYVGKKRSTTVATSRYMVSSTAVSESILFHTTTVNNAGIFANSATIEAPVGVTEYQILSAVYNGASSSFRANSIQLTSGNPGSTGFTGIRIGSNYDGSANFDDIDVAEVIAYSGALNAQDILSIEAYLAARYAIGYKAPNDASISTNLKLWVDPSSEAYADAASVTNYHDRSGNAYDLTPGTAPVFKTFINNGRPTVRFASASSQYLQNTSFPSLGGTASATIIAVKTRTSGDGMWLNGSADLIFPCIEEDGTTFYCFFDTISNYATFTYNSTAQDIISIVYDGSQSTNATKLKIYLNGIPQTLAFTGTIGATIPAGNGIVTGRRYGGTKYWNGDISDIAVYNAVLSDANRRAVENYMAQKYNKAV